VISESGRSFRGCATSESRRKLQVARDALCLNSLVRPTWIEPTLYPRLRDHPDLASSLLLLKSPDWSSTIAVYPISTLEVNNNLIVQDGRISANARRITSGEQGVWVMCAQSTEAKDEAGIVESVVTEARRLVGSTHFDKASTSDFWNGIGICTWEGLGAGGETPLSERIACSPAATRPTKDILLSLVPSYPTSTFLIDDGWQDVADHRGQSRHLHSFGPWDGFGASLSEVVIALKDKGVGEVGVWMTLQGYWNGIDPNSALKDKYECKPHRIAERHQPRGDVTKMKAGPSIAWLPSPEKAEGFWRDWLTELKEAGISFVKVS